MIRTCFSTGILWWVRPTSDKNRILHELKVSLRSCDVSSLAIDRLCDRAGGQDTAVVCLYFDFAD